MEGYYIMKKINYLEAKYFSIEKFLKEKKDKKVYVVFSTFGEREAELIYDKITLLKSEIGEAIDKIFLSHRRAGEAEELTEKKAIEADPGVDVLICNDYHVPDMGKEKGKGADMRRTLYYINTTYKKGSSEEDIIIVYLDADVVPEHFGPHFVLGLAGAVMEGQDFAKASFWRAMGRVKKFVAQPLFSVIDHPLLSGLSELAYPLSGEVAGTLKFFNSVNFWQIYGVETGINIDSCIGPYSIADVNLGLYDHEHHGDAGIQKMAFGIMRTYLTQLRDYGIIELKDNAKISNTFKANYIDESAERKKIEFDLTELKYRPMAGIL